MPWLRIPNAGSAGIVKDLSVHELPTGVWTDGLNVRFLDGYAQQFFGHGMVFGTPSAKPYFVMPVVIGTQRHWLYAGASTIYDVYDPGTGAVHTDLSGATYTATPNSWTGSVLGGIPILNNGTNDPQRWDLNLANNFQDLDNWPAATTCKAMRSFKNFLIALNVTKSGTQYPFMVKWSHPAEPGAVPSSWDETDATKDAGEFDLAEGYDPIVDGLQLRDSFIVYKQSSTWRLDYIGGPFIFRASKVFGTSGMLNRNCCVEVDGRHFVLTESDVIVHDGNQKNSVLDKITRRFLFNNMDAEAADKAFVFKNPFFNEVFVCYPQPGSSVPDRAMVWNYMDNTVSFREMPSSHHGCFGPVEETLAGTWDSDSAPWVSDISLWNTPGNVPSDTRVIMASDDTKLLLLDASTTFDGVQPDAFIERIGMNFTTESDEGVEGAERRVTIKTIRPRIKGNTGENVSVSIGISDDSPYDAPVYLATMTHTIGESVRNDCLVSGRYIAIKFESGTAYQWRLDSFDIEYELEGLW